MDDTIPEMIKNRVQKYGDRQMMYVKRGGEWRKITWNEFWSKVKRLGLGMISLGIKPQDRVAIFSDNSPEWQMTDIAVLSIGAIDVPLYSTITPKQAEYILSDSGARICFVGSEDHLRRVEEVWGNLPELMKVVTMDGTKSENPNVITFEELMEIGDKYEKPEEFDERMKALKPDDLCSFVYTSGTTGNPKGAMLTHNNFLSNVKACSEIIHVTDEDVCLSYLPLSHVLERMSGYYSSLYNGATIYHATSIDTILPELSEVRPHFMVSVPRLYEKFYAGVLANVESQSPFKQRVFNWAVRIGREVSKLKVEHKPIPLWLKLRYRIANKLVFKQIYELMGGRLKFFISGGGPLAKEIAEFFHSLGITIIEGYGLTETSPVTNVNRPDELKFGSVGRPIPGVEIKIAEDGEILVRGPNVMKGYWNRPEETAEAIDEEGWFYTGDIGYVDEDGYLHITDRKKDIIVTAGGKNIAPQNIENTLITCKYIEQVCVIGDKRKYLSALIVPNFEELEKWAKANGIEYKSTEELVEDQRTYDLIKGEIDNLLKDFDRHEQIVKFLLLTEEMTIASGLLTPTLKVRRRQVAETFADDIEKLYT
ncbi:MAG: long-chain fatty acid--CoA ligase [Actinomycetota bacterium]|nr:long-chain fatty acid--CoA ligase [Actinomycetota bacterium]